jgi:hypothetical protein
MLPKEHLDLERDTRFELVPQVWKTHMLTIEHQSRIIISLPTHE